MDNVLPPMADFVTAFQDRAERIERGQRRLGKGKQSGEYPQAVCLFCACR